MTRRRSPDRTPARARMEPADYGRRDPAQICARRYIERYARGGVIAADHVHSGLVFGLRVPRFETQEVRSQRLTDYSVDYRLDEDQIVIDSEALSVIASDIADVVDTDVHRQLAEMLEGPQPLAQNAFCKVWPDKSTPPPSGYYALSVMKIPDNLDQEEVAYAIANAIAQLERKPVTNKALAPGCTRNLTI